MLHLIGDMRLRLETAGNLEGDRQGDFLLMRSIACSGSTSFCAKFF